MFNISHKRGKPLSELEHLVMDFVWSHGRCSAEQVREHFARSRPMKDSTVRTVLRRLEHKGYLSHVVEGRTYYIAVRSRARAWRSGPSSRSSIACVRGRSNNS